MIALFEQRKNMDKEIITIKTEEVGEVTSENVHFIVTCANKTFIE